VVFLSKFELFVSLRRDFKSTRVKVRKLFAFALYAKRKS